MKLRVKRADEIELNLISLVDVVLLLVIFFMLSTSFVQDSHLRISLPEAGTASAERAPNAIVVTVSAQGSYRVNGRALVNNERATLGAALRQVAGDAGKPPVTIRADVRPARRGRVRIGPLTLRTAGPLGLAGRQATLQLIDGIRVYPALHGRAEVALRLQRARLLQAGRRSAAFRGGGSEFDALREYRPDDEFRRINWRATARAPRPIANEYREEHNQQVVVLLDASRPPVRLNSPLAAGGDVTSGGSETSFRVSADSRWVVYRATGADNHRGTLWGEETGIFVVPAGFRSVSGSHGVNPRPVGEQSHVQSIRSPRRVRPRPAPRRSERRRRPDHAEGEGRPRAAVRRRDPLRARPRLAARKGRLRSERRGITGRAIRALAASQLAPRIDHVEATVRRADDFSYLDPVDGSTSSNQGIRVFFDDGSRAVFRLSGTGTSGATLRLYMDRFTDDPALLEADTSQLLADLASAAGEIAEIARRTRRTEPSLVT